jgi:hypothetical protein
MKTLLGMAIGSLVILASTPIFADCYSAGRFEQCPDCNEGSPYVTQCQCTDPSMIRQNPCISNEKYCQAFGNPGAR